MQMLKIKSIKMSVRRSTTDKSEKLDDDVGRTGVKEADF